MRERTREGTEIHGSREFDQPDRLLYIEAVGVVVIVAGIVYAVAHYGRQFFNDRKTSLYQDFRRHVGRSLMLGLEFLVAGDIIRTVVISHSVSDVAALGLLVLVRTVLVFTIHLEVEGRWPWQPATDEEAQG